MSCPLRSVIFISFLTLPLSAQILSLGIKGGVPLTDALSARDVNPNGTFGQCADCATARNLPYIVGPALEIAIKGPFSFVAEALYSRVDYTHTGSASSVLVEKHAVDRWQVPVMLKIQLPSWHHLTPFVSGGATFESTGDLTLISRNLLSVGQGTVAGAPVIANTLGATFAVGVGYRLGAFRPTLEYRYTRWAGEPILLRASALAQPSIETPQRQFELLAGLMFNVGHDANASSGGGPVPTPERRVRFGVKGGVPILAAVTVAGAPTGVSFENIFHTCLDCGSARTVPYVAGPSVEIRLADSFRLSVDALYSRADYNHTTLFGFRPSWVATDAKHTVNQWEFPVLLKYTMAAGSRWEPFLEGGASVQYSADFEATRLDVAIQQGIDIVPPAVVSAVRSGGSSIGRSAVAGPTFGAGVGLRLRQMRSSLVFRYTRWVDTAIEIPSLRFTPGPAVYSGQNQAQLLLGLTF